MILVTVAVLTAVLCSTGHGQAGRTVYIENGSAQMFVDDFLIDKQAGVKRTLHQPVKDDGGNVPVIELDNEFVECKGTLEANGSIVYDTKLRKWVMFALGYSSHWIAVHQRWDCVRVYRFTSSDGINWVKGDDGKPQLVYPRSPEDLKDSVTGNSATNIDLFSCYYDSSDRNYPYKGWLYFANWGSAMEGVFYMRSRDGIHWERKHQVVDGFAGSDDKTYREIHQDGRVLCGPGDVTVFYHDPVTDKFLAAFKFWSPQIVGPGNNLRCRAYAFLEDIDVPFDISKIKRIALLPAAAKINGDEPADEYYGSAAWRYGSLWLGGLKVWHGQGNYPYSAAGCAFLKMAVSRDGLNWNKVPYPNDSDIPEVFIANGKEGGNSGRNDGGYITEFSQGPLRISDELIFYYGCSSYGKNHPVGVRVTGGGIFRARLRIDGFVSVDAGEILTKPLQFSGNELFINSAGEAGLDVLDLNGSVLGSASVKGDSTGHQVKFDGKSLSEVSEGKPVRLRFRIEQGGSLYSFTIS